MTTKMMLRDHADYTELYSLLEELCAAGADYGLSWPVQVLLAEALNELTSFETDVPGRPVPPHIATGEQGLARIELLLSGILADLTGLGLTLRVIRVRELVTRARGTA